jgi:hypothetical protein
MCGYHKSVVWMHASEKGREGEGEMEGDEMR